jgi:hypothetical protein
MCEAATATPNLVEPVLEAFAAENVRSLETSTDAGSIQPSMRALSAST